MATDYNALIAQYAALDPNLSPETYDTSNMPETKKANVERAASEKRAAMAGPKGYNLATMANTGAGMKSASQMDRDYLTMDPNSFKMKYSNEAGDSYAAQYSQGTAQHRNDTQRTRSDLSGAGDIANTILAAPVNLVGSIGALAGGGLETAGAAPEGTGVYLSDKLGKFNRWAEGLKSSDMAAARRSSNAENTLLENDTNQQRDINAEEYGDRVAGAIKIAADVKNGLKTGFSNPTVAVDTVANAGGSLIGGGFVAGGLKKLGSAILKGATKVGAVEAGGVAATKIASFSGKAAMPISMVGMESGAAYQQTTEQAYNELIAQGVSPEEANQRANKAGLESAAIQGAITTAIMPFTGGAKFESAPFHVPNVRTAIKHAIGETVEEGIQEGSAQYATNQAILNEVDPNQSLTEGVGGAAALGIIGGLGSSVSTQAPGIALRGAVTAAKLPFRAVGKGLIYLGDRVDARNQKVRDGLLNGIYDGAVEAAPEVEASLDGVAPDVATRARETLSKLGNHPLMQEAARTVLSAGTNVRERLTALAGLSAMVSQSQEEQEKATPAELVGTAFQSIKDVVSNASQSQTVQRALTEGRKLYDQVGPALNTAMKGALDLARTTKQEAPVDAEVVTDPEAAAQPSAAFADVQENLSQIAAMAEITPEKVDGPMVREILMHDEQGDITLTPKQRATFKSTMAIADAAQKGIELGARYGMVDAQRVSEEVLTAKPKEGSKLSLVGHLKGIQTAFNAGETEQATQFLFNLRNFAQHLNNRVEATNAALAGGNTSDANALSFDAHIGDGKFRPSKTAYIQPRSPKAVKFAQTVAMQAQIMATAVNSLSDALGLPINKVTPVDLNNALDGDATEVAQRFVRPKQVSQKEVTPSLQEDVAVDETVAPVDDADTIALAPVAEPEVQAVSEDAASVAPFEKPTAEKVEAPVAEAPPVQDEPVALDPEKTPEAIPEVEVKPSEAPVIAEEKPAQAVEPTRVGGKANRLTTAFQAPKNPKTRIADSVSPLQSVRDTLSSEDSLKTALGTEKLNRSFSKQVAAAYGVYLGFADGIVQQLNERMQKIVGDKLKRGQTFEKMLDFLEGGALNVVVENSDGSYTYDPNKAETATLAALQWYLKMNNHGAPLSDQDVRDMFGLDDNTSIPSDLGRDLSSGLSPVEVSRSLAQEISRFWGLDTRADAPENHAQSVREGMAKELLESMVDLGLIEEFPVNIESISTRENVTFVNRYRPASLNDADGKPLKASDGTTIRVLAADNPVRQFPTAIEKAAVLESEELTYVGEAPKTVAATQLRSNVPTTDQQKDVIVREQATEHRLNMPFINMLTSMGEDLVMRMFGGGDMSGDLNINHKRSLEGRNLTVQSAYRALQNTVAEVTNAASMDGRDVSDMPIHYAYAYTVVNRLQMLGKDNPQSNKLMRESILPTWDVLDMTDPDNRMKFSLGLAQALGVKVHTLGTKEMLASLKKTLDGLPKTMEMLSKKDTKLTAADVDTMKAEAKSAGTNMSFVALHTLMEYVRLQASDEAARKEFRTAVYFEADGVTNGVINAMSLFTSGQFTPEWISNIERGGVWIGEKVMNLANLRGRDSASEADLYKVAAGGTSTNVSQLLSAYVGTQVHPQITAVLDLLNTFLPGVEYDAEKGLLIDRKATKNPLTITIYGSGPAGIAGNILDAVLDEMYSRMSDAAAASAADPSLTASQALFGGDVESANTKSAHFQQTMKALSYNRLGTETNNKVKTLVVSDGAVDKEGRALPWFSGKTSAEFTINPKSKKAMQDNILHAFVEPMVRSITNTVGEDLIRTMNLIKTQTQSWGLVGQFMYQNAYEKALTAKRAANPEMNSYELLSKAENEAILKSVQANLPAFSTGTQNFAFGGRQKLNLPFMTSKKGNALELEFSRSLTDGFNTPAFGNMPGDPGVSGMPGMTIASGDGQAIQNIIMDPETPEARLQIYDGIHSRVRELDAMSRAANKGVLNSWKNNPLRALVDGFQSFVEQADLSSLTQPQLDVLGKSLLNNWDGGSTREEIISALKLKAKQGSDMAAGIDKRQAVLSRVQMSVDQMAGAGVPFAQTGEVLSGSPKDVASQLNRMLAEDAPAPVVEQTAASDSPAETSRPITVTGGKSVLFLKSVERAITKMTSDKLIRQLLRDVVRSGTVDDYTIQTGSRTELIQRAENMGISIAPDRQGTFMGFMDPTSKQIFAVDANPETILHELIHAATYETIQSHYAGQSTSDVSDAIGRIEALMADFKNANSETVGYQNALDEMERQANTGNQAGELNEFMAWALSNPEIAAELQTTKVNPLVRLARAAVRELKALLFGGKRSAAVKDDVFSNLRFNTSIIMRSEAGAQQMMKEGLLFHDPSFGSSDRLNTLLSSIKDKIADYVDGTLLDRAVSAASVKKSTIRGATVSQAFAEAGFSMNMQERMAFLHMVGIMGTAAQLDSNTTSRMQDIYSHVLKQLSIDDFLTNPGENDSADTEQATKKFNLIAGKFAQKVDGMDRSLVLPAFIALSMTNTEFRQKLSKMDMPKGKFAQWNSVDNILDNIGGMSMDLVGRAVSGEGVTTKNSQEALDNLVVQMLETNADAELYIEKFTKPVGGMTDRANEWMISMFDKLGKGAERLVDRTRTNNPGSDRISKLKVGLAETMRTMTGMLHEPTGLEASMKLISASNQSSRLPTFAYDLINDLVGRTDENSGVYDLIKIARQFVSGLRQQYVEEFPKIILGKFTRELSEGERTSMHRGLAQTDMASLLTSNSIEQVLEWVQSASKRDIKTKQLKDSITALSPSNAAKLIAKADQLANFMVEKKTGTNLLRNANAVATLLGEGVQDPVVTDEMVEMIDHYVSLKALSNQPSQVTDGLFSLVHSEAAGLDFVLNSLRGQRDIDLAKASGNAKFNHYKGFMTASTAPSSSLQVAYDGEADGSLDAKKLISMGYVRLGALKGSERDPTAKNRSYWYAPVSGKSGYSQGIAQNVQQTVSGADAMTGLTTSLTGGAITDQKLIQRISQSTKPESYGAALLPVYNENGKLIAYERQVEPRMLDKQKPDLDLPSMMGVRSGRQAEEAAAGLLNRTLVDRLRDMWEKDRKIRSKEYIDLFKSTDPVHQDSVKIMSREMRSYIDARFPEGFMVRKDMINDAIGYRAASIGDAWTGTSRWSEATQTNVRQMLKGMFGNKAYVRAVQAEKFLQNSIVQDLRTMIVIRSVVVPAANAVSNVYQLIGRGVPIVDVFRGIPKKTAEIEAWHKTRLRQMEAQAELLATTDTLQINRLEAEIKSITDSHKRLTIWPLLEAGEFSSISDAGSREDVLLTEGKLSDYIEALVDKLPAGLKTAGKYAIISKDTALFRALQKTVDYGDFVAKAILYDDLTKRQGKSAKASMAQVTEEFVNYDRLPGRDRQYLESIGLLWFWNFKVRSTKVALSMIRNNPVHAMLSLNLPTPIGGIGMPIQDSLPMALLDGRLLNSMGLHMAFRAPGLLPVGELFG